MSNAGSPAKKRTGTAPERVSAGHRPLRAEASPLFHSIEGAQGSLRSCTPQIVRPSGNIGRSRGHRGSLYIAVLGMVLIVTVIGISAMLAARVEWRALADTEATTKAECGAASIMDLALFWISADRNWRTTYTSGTWTAAVVADGMTLRFKLVDELDGNLANDATQPVRLYAKAIVSPAVRIESVLCQPNYGWNLVANGGMENGGAGWYTRNGTIEIRTDGAHSGVDYVRVKGRTLVTDGLGQTLTGGLKNGTTYQIEIWVCMKSGSDSLVVGLLTNSTVSGSTATVSAGTAISTAWQKVTVTLTPTWSGLLLSSDLYMATTTTKTEFNVDDVVVSEQGTLPALIPIPGTWRQEIRAAPVGDLPAAPS